jgi:hypothetical protein
VTPPARLAARSAILLCTLFLAALVTANGLATRVASSDPVLAARLSPSNAEFAITAATHIAGKDAGTHDPEVRRLVAAALSRSVSDPAAIAVRGLEEGTDGNPRAEARLFALSDLISRRHLPTRLWLIQNAVDRGDLPAALRNFDLALRTSTDAPAALFPVMARAAADPQVTPGLARLLDRPSDWRAPFAHYVITQTGSAANLAGLVGRLHDRSWLETNGLDDTLIVRLVADGQFAAARRTYDLLHRSSDAGALVHDSHFADPRAVFPFGWVLVQKGEIGAERSLIGGRPALGYRALPGGAGAVANQLLMLPTGRYQLTVRASASAADVQAPPYWTLTCASEPSDQLALLDAPVARGALTSKVLTVPAWCSAQWLVLSLRSSDEPGGQTGALASIELTRL